MSSALKRIVLNLDQLFMFLRTNLVNTESCHSKDNAMEIG